MSPTRFRLPRLAVAACLAIGAATCAEAQTYDAQAYGAYGFAEPLVRGDYVGAPLTRIPRSYDLVPSAWGYGTYGIPTVAGIRHAPIGEPTVYVIESPARAARAKASAGPRILSRGRAGRWSRMAVEQPRRAGGARVVSLDAPRR